MFIKVWTSFEKLLTQENTFLTTVVEFLRSIVTLKLIKMYEEIILVSVLIFMASIVVVQAQVLYERKKHKKD